MNANVEGTEYFCIADYADSSRTVCKQCKRSIMKGNLCIGLYVQSASLDLKFRVWHHFECFFKVNELDSTDEIENFSSLSYDDQQRVMKNVGRCFKNVGKAKAVKREPSAFSVGYVTCDRTICKVCLKVLEQGEIHITKQEYECKGLQRFCSVVTHSHHLECFAHVKHVLGYTGLTRHLPGFSALQHEDQTKLMSALEKSGRKRKRMSSDEEQPVKRFKKAKTTKRAGDRKLKAQSDLLFTIRQKLESSLNESQLIRLLARNEQFIPSERNSVLNVLADCVAFGALKKCPVCEGQFILSDKGYKCQGQANEWSQCAYQTDVPERRKFQFPRDLSQMCKSLKEYSMAFAKRSRLFPPKSGLSCKRSRPLYNFKISVVGFVMYKRKEIVNMILHLGGEVVEKISSDVTCVIASEDVKAEFEEALEIAKKNDITVVSESFLAAAKHGRAAYHLAEHAIKPWGVGTSDEAQASRKLFEKQKLKKCVLTGSTKISSADHEKKLFVENLDNSISPDPDSGLDGNVFMVYVDGSVPCSCVLVLVDITRGTNSFYKIQVLCSKSWNCGYYLFESFGRVGSVSFGKQVTRYSSRHQALSDFRKFYFAKTRNVWNSDQEFVKYPDCFYPVKLDCGQDDLSAI